MYFQIRELILWPRDDREPRRVPFELGKVNVISGASKTGKSAVIPIIDYCLGSDRCAIPVGVIRDSCTWFGVLIDTLEGQKLLARREPGDQQQTGDMFVIEAPIVEVPQSISEKNTTATIVKDMLNRLAGLTNLKFEPDSENSFKSRPGFRDLMAFVMQPQNIVANPDVMFFKADTTEHREKLKTIFPYVLQAVNADTLAARAEVDRLQKILRRKESELAAAMVAINTWKAEAQTWVSKASEYGLVPPGTDAPVDWGELLDLLRVVSKETFRQVTPSLEGIEGALKRLSALRAEEANNAGELSENRQRLSEVLRLIESSQSYSGALRVQRDRLSISSWLRQLAEESTDPVLALGSDGRGKVLELCTTLDGLEVQLRTFPTMSDALGKEQVRLRGRIEEAIGKLNRTRTEIVELERISAEARAVSYRADQIERFLGRLEQALVLYDRADTNAELRDEIRMLTEQILALRGGISDGEIARRMAIAVKSIEGTAARIIPKLDAEWPEAPIELEVKDLTIKVLNKGRADYLWEVGSGANWLAYHVAVTLSLQAFFLAQTFHPVPALLIYDQPSQVYFPKRLAGAEEVEGELRDEDVAAVRKVFVALADEVAKVDGRLQIIVLDHAHEDVWGGIDKVSLIAEWRAGNKLVPQDWPARPPAALA